MMGSFNSGTRKDLDLAVDMTANNDGSYVDLSPYQWGLFSITWKDANATDGTIKIQQSDTALAGSWEDYPKSEYTIATAAGVHYWDVLVRAGWFYRLVYSKGSNTSGEFDTAVRVKAPIKW